MKSACLLLTVILLLAACQAPPKAVQGDLSGLYGPGVAAEIEKIEAQWAGGEHRRRAKALETEGLRLMPDQPGLLQVETLPARLEMAPALIGLPADWQAYAALEVRASAAAACRLRAGSFHVNGPLLVEETLEAGQTITLRVPLQDLPLTAGVSPPYAPSVIRLEISEVRGALPFTLNLEGIALVTAGPDHDRRVVDRFGQRISQTWPGKVISEADLVADREEEVLPEPPDGRSTFGGWADGPRHAATGFFRVKQLEDGTWWFIDPEGYRFWSAGITCVNIGSDWTPVEGREFLYEKLPEDGSPAVNEDGWVNFFYANVLRKYDSLEDWRARTLARMQGWGFNTIGNWSNGNMMRPGQLSYTRTLTTRFEDSLRTGRRIPDVFSPAWETRFETHLQEYAAPHRDDPWLIGYFVDNELPWLHLRLLDAPAEKATKQEWGRFARQELGSLTAAKALWGDKVQAWEDLLLLTEADCPAGSAAGTLRKQFEAHYAVTYFEKVSHLLNKHDPNHLYLGCRFVRRAPAREIVQAAGKYCDVLTVNCYAWEPNEKQFGEWYAMAGRPVLIGEHHVPLESPRQVPPPWEDFDAAQRERYYRNFVEVWARRPYSLGCHYFQLIDQPLTGRFDGENRIIGWLDITDQPHQDLVRAARAALPQLYTWHDQARSD